MLQRYRGLSVQAKATIWFFACNIVQKGIATLTVPIFIRLMSTAEYGLYTCYLSWVEVLLKFTSLNLYLGVFNNAMLKCEGEERNRYISSMQGLTCTLEFGVIVIYVLFSKEFNRLFEMPTKMVAFMFAQLLFTPCLQFWMNRQRFEYKYKAVVVVTLMQAIANPLLGIVMVLHAGDRASARIASVVIVELTVGGALALYQFLKGKTFFDKEYWRYSFFFNLPLLPHNLSNTVLNHGDRIMIKKMVSDDKAAVYSVAYSVGMLVQLVTNAINASFTPWVYENLKAERYELIRRTISAILFGMACLVMLSMFFAPEIIYIVGPKEYLEAVYVVPPVAAGVFFIFLYNTLIYAEYYYEENKMVMFASVAAAFGNVGLNYLFIPTFGFVAAGYTTLLSYIMLALLHYFLARRACIKHIGEQRIFDVKKISAMALCVIAFSIGIRFLYSYMWIRYGLFLVGMGLGYWKRNAIFTLMKQIRKR